MNTGQIQLRVTLTDQLYDFLVGRASRLGIPVTQVVKHMIIEKAQQEEYPTFQASVKTEKSYQGIVSNKDKFIEVSNLKRYLDSL